MPSPRKHRGLALALALVLAAAACVLCPQSAALSFGGVGRRARPPGRSAGAAVAAPPDRRDDGASSVTSSVVARRAPAAAGGRLLRAAGAASRPGRRLLARGRRGIAATRLNYRDLDDEDLLRITSGTPRTVAGIVRRIRERRRRSLTKELFPPSEDDGEGEESGSAIPEGALSESEREPEPVAVDEPTAAAEPAKRTGKRKGIKLRKKSKPRVSVSDLEGLRRAVLDDGVELRHVDLKYTIPPSLRSTVRRDGKAAATTELFSELQLPAVLRANEDTLAEHAGGGTHHIEFTTELSDFEFYVGGGGEGGEGREMDAAELQLVGNVLAENSPCPHAWEEGADEDEDTPVFSHDVLNVLRRRYATRSAPGARDEDDEAVLALSIEGGGMRGAGEF